MRSPILLSAEAVVDVNSKVELATPELANPYNTAMWLDEVRMQSFRVGNSDFNPFHMKLRLSLGRVPLTSDFIPIPMFGKVLNSFGTWSIDGAYTWKLPRPLYIPGGEFVVSTVFNDPMDLTAQPVPQRIRITYVGRSLGSDDRPPGKIDVPWVAMFAGPTHPMGADFAEESKETDLYNPFNEPLKVQRFIGRMTIPAGEFIQPEVNRLFTLVRMTDSQGRFVVKDPTPFAHLFFINEMSWNVNAVLPPKGFYIVSLNQNYSSVDSMIEPVKPFISIIGHREVSLRL